MSSHYQRETKQGSNPSNDKQTTAYLQACDDSVRISVHSPEEHAHRRDYGNVGMLLKINPELLQMVTILINC